MNSYFKTHEEIDQLFQLAFAELNKNGYDNAADLFNAAFRRIRFLSYTALTANEKYI